MIHLPHKDKDTPPVKLTCFNALVKLRRIVVQGDGNLYTNTYYRDDEVVDLLRALSIHKTALDPEDRAKCNYCESRIEKAAVLQVEHYRPKAKVDPCDTGGTPHSGYYWLGHEWSNLLLACPQCNGPSAKGNRFPVRGNRAVALQPVCAEFKLDRTGCLAHEGPLLAEDPLLLNPEIDIPDDFLTFDLKGEIHGHGPDAERGTVSKNIYDLNRPFLVVERLDVWIRFKKSILEDISAHMLGVIDDAALLYLFKKTAKEILKRREVTEEYTLWGRYINDKINRFIETDIEADAFYRDLFRQAYQASISSINASPVPAVTL